MKEKTGYPLSAEEVSLILGISEFTVKQLAKAGDLPCVYENRRPRFRIEELLECFARLEKEAAA
jgi:predicted site-specific integrase-resolvase